MLIASILGDIIDGLTSHPDRDSNSEIRRGREGKRGREDHLP